MNRRPLWQRQRSPSLAHLTQGGRGAPIRVPATRYWARETGAAWAYASVWQSPWPLALGLAAALHLEKDSGSGLALLLMLPWLSA